ncbi:MAG: hypothetical protein ACFB3T_07970 [Geminicoccaceae bacterium]
MAALSRAAAHERPFAPIGRVHVCDHYIIQGTDFKARSWLKPIGERAKFFDTATQLTQLLRLSGSKCLIFRYMNSSPNILLEIMFTCLLATICLCRRWLDLRIFWILHNIDRESYDHFPFWTRLRRATLWRTAEKVFVTDQLFKELYFRENSQVEAISFGQKRTGSIKPATLAGLERLRARCDQIGMAIGSSHAKCVHNQRLAHLQALAAKAGIRLGLLVSSHAQLAGDDVLHVDEPDIDETALRDRIDFVYRINDDISMPYTIYTAAGAGLPIVTSAAHFTHKIVERHGIGFSEEGWFSAGELDIARVKGNLRAFAAQGRWASLTDRLP